MNDNIWKQITWSTDFDVLMTIVDAHDVHMFAVGLYEIVWTFTIALHHVDFVILITIAKAQKFFNRNSI